MLRFNCQHCRKKCKAPPEAAGKLGRCPGCNRSIQIPLSVEPIDSTAPPSDDKVIDATLDEEPVGASSKAVMLEEAAAGRFVLAMIGVVGRHWAELTADFRPAPEDAERFDDILGGQREFMLAVLAVQFQEVVNFCPTDQAKRIRRYIYKLLDLPAMSYDGGGIAAFEAYEAAFKKGMATSGAPFGALTAELYYRIGIRPPTVFGGIIAPSVVFLVGQAIAFQISPWWPKVLASYRLVPQTLQDPLSR